MPSIPAAITFEICLNARRTIARRSDFQAIERFENNRNETFSSAEFHKSALLPIHQPISTSQDTLQMGHLTEALASISEQGLSCLDDEQSGVFTIFFQMVKYMSHLCFQTDNICNEA
jgi:hypothetical protein